MQLIDTALRMGLRHAVLSPGARNTPLVLALHDAKESGKSITLHSVIDERAAGFFALGIARRTDTPVLLSCTSGSAAANYFPAIVEASEGQVPLLVVTADRPEELQDCGSPQTMPQKDLYGSHVRSSISLNAPSDSNDIKSIAQATAAAWQASTSNHPGPSHINLRFRKPLWSPETDDFNPIVLDSLPKPKPSPKPEEISRFLKETEGKRGVIVVGTDPSQRINSDAIIEMAKRLGWPILSDPINGLRFGATGPIVRHHDAMLRSEQFVETYTPDVAIVMGGTTSSRPLEEMLRSTKSLAIKQSKRPWNPWGSVEWSLGCTPSELVKALSTQAIESSPDGWLDGWLKADHAAKTAIQIQCKDELWEGSIAHHLVAKLTDNTLLRVASSMPIRDIDSFAVDNGVPLSVSSNRGVNGIDGTIATTFGEAFVHHGPTAALMGDLSFLHDSSALLTTPHPRHPTVITIVNNGGGGIFGFLPMKNHQTGFKPWYVTPHQHDIGAICSAAGITTFEPTSLNGYVDALDQALHSSGVTVIHVRVDREFSTQRHFEAWASICDAVEAKL